MTRTAAEVFAQLHDDLGHTVEGLAALLGEALCEISAGDAPSRRKALDALHVIVSKPLATGTDGAARQAFEGTRQAALTELVKLCACGPEAQKTLDAAHDFELLYPLEANAPRSKEVARVASGKVLERRRRSGGAQREKRYDNAVEACETQLIALDEADEHWTGAGQLDTANVRHIGVQLDLLDALVGAKEWQRADGLASQLGVSLPAELRTRFEALQGLINAGKKKL